MKFWCAEQLVVTLEGPAGRSVVSLAQPFARVGNHPEADVVIADPAVAVRCLYLHATSQGVFCLYLDVPTSDPQDKGRWLSPDQDVVVGEYRVRASLLTAEFGDAVPSESLAEWGSAPPPLPVMMVYCGTLLKDKRRFRARLSPIGRRPQCGLQLKGEKVSSFHCVLYWEHDELWCVDLNSSNGTTLNGAAVVCNHVAIGDRLEVGEFGLVFQRLSSGRSPRTATALRREPAAAAPARPAAPVPPAAPLLAAASDLTPALPAVASILTGPTPEQRAREAEEQKLREQLAAEVAHLARERQEMHARWSQATEQLQTQIGQLHDEAARLAAERSTLEQSRSQWRDERSELTSQLTERSAQLARLETELMTTAAALSHKLAEVEKRESANVLQQIPTPAVEPPPPEASSAADRERQLQAQWESTSERLTVQIEQLQAESAELAAQRQALDLSRQDWQLEREQLQEQLSARAQQLFRLEAELTATSASLASSVAERRAEEQRRTEPPRPMPSEPIDASLLAELAPATIVASSIPQSAAEMASVVVPEVAWNFLLAEPAADVPQPPDPQAQLQARWDETNERLTAQVEQLRAEAAELAAQRQALAQSRDDWQAQRDVLSQQLTERQQELARQQAELTLATASLAAKLSSVEQRMQQPASVVIETAQREDEIPAAREGEALVSQKRAEPLSSDEIINPASSATHPASEYSPIDSAPQIPAWVQPPAAALDPMAHRAMKEQEGGFFGDRDELTVFMSDRLVSREQELTGSRWLWWTAGGIGAAVLIAIIVTGLIWALGGLSAG